MLHLTSLFIPYNKNIPYFNLIAKKKFYMEAKGRISCFLAKKQRDVSHASWPIKWKQKVLSMHFEKV
jgi:hypothetical protein